MGRHQRTGPDLFRELGYRAVAEGAMGSEEAAKRGQTGAVLTPEEGLVVVREVPVVLGEGQRAKGRSEYGKGWVRPCLEAIVLPHGLGRRGVRDRTEYFS